MQITTEDINLAYERIKHIIHRTPVLKSDSINKLANAEILFKCENFQKVGAFKYRGATNAVQSLTEQELSSGVCTHSSGNHAQALALAAKIRGAKSYIIMPSNAPQVKIDGVKAYQGEIFFCEPNLQARESTLDNVQSQTNSTFIHPFKNALVISGQGTASKELLEEVPDLEVIITPVGGGGLLSGTSIYAKGFNSNIQVYGAEPEGASDAHKSFYSGELVSHQVPNTVCDGLLTTLGDINFEIIKKNVDGILLANDKEIIEAMLFIWNRMKIIVEPSCAVPLAVVLKNKEKFEGKKIGIILSGGNIDFSKLKTYL
jgi:threonine dehydratase